VQGNPNDVLTAKVVVATHGARSLWVLYQSPDGGVSQTPTVDAANAAQTVPVLGLAPSTSYRVQAIASDDDGGLARSAVLSFTTQALPAFLSSYAFDVTQPGAVMPGYVLISKLGRRGAAQAAVIVDRGGRVAWYAQPSGALAGDFQKQLDHSYTIAESVTGMTGATYDQVDALSDLVRTWTLPGGADIHDLVLEPNGDALMLGRESEQADLTAYGGSATATLLGNIFVRVSPDGGVQLSSSFFADFDPGDVAPQIRLTGTNVDAVHANAIGVTADGNDLVSARNLSQVRKLDAQTGKVIWKLGGARSDFAFTGDPLGGFTLQHFAREVGPDDILMFDDGNGHTPQHSRAVEYQLHFDAQGAPTTAEMIWQYTPPPDANGVPVFAAAMGSAQRLPDGHTLICYGTQSRIDEVDAQGTLVWQLVDPNPGTGIYRGLFIPSLY